MEFLNGMSHSVFHPTAVVNGRVRFGPVRQSSDVVHVLMYTNIPHGLISFVRRRGCCDIFPYPKTRVTGW